MNPTDRSTTPGAARRLAGRLFHFSRRRAAPLALAPLALLAGALLPAGLLRADTLILKSGTGFLPPVEATVLRIEGNDLIYTSQQNDRETKRPLDLVWQIKSVNDPKLTAAEQAYADQKWADAVTNYEAALNSTQTDWVKTRSTLRLIDAAAQSKQFAPQVTAFAELAKRDPANARKHQPDLKGVKADEIKPAMAGVERALTGATKKETSDLLKEFLANMYMATGDTQGAAKVLGAGAAAPAAGSGGSVGVGAAAAGAGGGTPPDLILARAKVALAGQQYQQVITDINNNKAAFTDPGNQADALYDLAQAKYATAGDNPQALQDAAIAYMRLVAHFDGRPAPLSANVPASLLAVGEIEEKLKQPGEAKQVYLQLANDPKLKGTPVQQKATERLNALKAKEGG